MTYIFKSSRLGFRQWNKEDLAPFAQMNSDKEVMEFYAKTLSKEESDAFVARVDTMFETYGYGLYAVEELETKEFIGYIGFWHVTFESPYTPFIEIGWKLRKEKWNLGYATEGALACLEYGFRHLGLPEVYSLTPVTNVRSEGVMKKIGMTKIDEFEHPKIEDGSTLKTHVLYKLENINFKKPK